jgi:hypothetical protein
MFDTPQDAPWPVGTKLRYTGSSQSGFIDRDTGETVWCHVKGAAYTVVAVYPSDGYDNYHDTDERYPVHGWSALQSEFDPGQQHMRAIDVDSMHDYQQFLVTGA